MPRALARASLAVSAVVLLLAVADHLAGAEVEVASAQLPAGVEGRLVLPRNRDLWQVAPGSGAEQRVLAGTSLTAVTQASWSPDGRRVAYSLFRFWRPERPAGSDLLVVPADGGDPVTVLPAIGEDVSFTEPVWTPDGQSLIHAAVVRIPDNRFGETTNQVERVPVAGGDRVLLADDAFSPAVSRDGRQLAFVRAPLTAGQVQVALWVAELDGRNPRALLADRSFSSFAFPRFAPTGDRLAFAAVGGPATIRRGGSGPLPWLRGRVAHAHGEPWDLWEIRLDGSGLRRLTDLAEDDPALAWSPNGRWIAFQGGSGVNLVGVETTTLYSVSQTVGFGGIDWTP